MRQPRNFYDDVAKEVVKRVNVTAQAIAGDVRGGQYPPGRVVLTPKDQAPYLQALLHQPDSEMASQARQMIGAQFAQAEQQAQQKGAAGAPG